MATVLGQRVREAFDWPLFVTTCAIAVVGVVNLYSATSAAPGPAIADLYIQQIYWLALGASLAVLAAAVDYRHYERFGYVAFGIGLAALMLVFLLGRNIRGSQRWIPIGSFSFQPSEFMKILLVIALAKYLHNDPRTEGRTLKDLVVPGAIVAVPIVLILRQPDLGTACILAFIFASVMLMTRLKLRSLLTIGIVFATSVPLTWRYLLHDYQKRRFESFLDPCGERVLSGGWHACQSLIAVGSGTWIGKGFLQGTQNQHGFLPDQHSDFPFAVWAEEHGFFGSLALIFLYVFLVLWAIKIASSAKDRFGAVLSVGMGAIFFWHAFINMGMVTGVLPVVGVTLPLFSYGGSSVVTVLLAIGLLMNVSMRRFHFQ